MWEPLSTLLTNHLAQNGKTNLGRLGSGENRKWVWITRSLTEIQKALHPKETVPKELGALLAVIMYARMAIILGRANGGDYKIQHKHQITFQISMSKKKLRMIFSTGILCVSTPTKARLAKSEEALETRMQWSQRLWHPLSPGKSLPCPWQIEIYSNSVQQRVVGIKVESYIRWLQWNIWICICRYNDACMPTTETR